MASRSPSRVQRAAAELFDAATAFIRFYQFRDRNAVLSSGLTVSQSYTLGILISTAGSSLNALAAGLRLDKSTTSRIVAGMSRHGLVEWSRIERDRRELRIVASVEGRRRYARHRRAIERENARLLASYSPSGQRAIITALRRLTERASGPPAPASGKARRET